MSRVEGSSPQRGGGKGNTGLLAEAQGQVVENPLQEAELSVGVRVQSPALSGVLQVVNSTIAFE